MTNSEALEAMIGFAPSNANAMELQLGLNGLTSSDVWDPVNYIALRKSLLGVLRILFSTPDTGNTDPSQSIKFDRGTLAKWINDLEAELYPEEVLVPTIRGIRVW
jgi:hypothetical protein